ncbi:MAG TPA: amine dehydrogenase large subunit [Steroidobacteraceae bacterium]|jgi:methylamine dehydrogenase heavy chain|nr:amine dehydrogenase large subunit [Steroidobacteraceae bacterium]
MQSLARCAAMLGLALASSPLCAAPPPPLPAEHLTIEHLPPHSPHWVYVVDYAFGNEIDGRVHLFDGDTYRRLGQVGAGFNPGFNLSPDRSTLVVTTTYFARGSHGTRTDVVEFTDNSTLATTHEIVLPPKRLQAVPTLFNIAYSDDGHFVYVAYMTPAASFGVLDPAKGTVLAEIDTAGCVLVIPSGPNRVSSLCESGRLLTVTLDAQGHEASRSMSAPFFDPDKDPVFVQGIRTAKGFAFLSFLGELHEVDLSGPQPVFATPWSLVTPAERGDWRPGGEQVGAIHRTLGKLFVPMHRGGEETHKDGGTELWVFDLTTHKRVSRWSMKAAGIGPVLALEVSQDPEPLLFLATDAADLAVLDAATGRVRHVEKAVGQTPWQLLTP